MYRECHEQCPIQSSGKCTSGDAHKTDFDKDCKEKKRVIQYFYLKKLSGIEE